MSNVAAWPIRIGGIYIASSGDSYGVRVTEIDGDTIYSTTLTLPSYLEGGNWANDADAFRRMYSPEDQSPLPAMKLFLQKIIDVAESGAWQSQGRYLAYEARELLAERKVSA